MTIYCLAAGMEEQKSGNLEEALKYYQSACENHSTQGHLRACTPFLSVARQLGRLDEAASGLETRCREGDDVICFYLAKEFFKITEYSRGHIPMERLCRENFQPPDPADYGPCYHLGKSLEQVGNLERAGDVFKFDCERDAVKAKPSCDRFDAVMQRLRLEESKKALLPIELAPFLIVLIPYTGLFVLRYGGRRSLQIVRIAAPVIAVGCWAVWECYAPKELTLRSDLFFILPALSLVLSIAWIAFKRLQISTDRPGFEIKRPH